MIPFIGTILSSLFKKYSTVDYPAKPKVNDKTVRGIIENEIEKCIFCGICQKKCPTGAITVDKPIKKWEIQRFACIQCGCCTELCPKKCLTLTNTLPNAGIDKNEGVSALFGAPAENTNA